MVAARRMRLFGWSLILCSLTAGYGSLLILWWLGDWISTAFHRYPGAFVLSLAVPLLILQVALAQWLLGIRLAKVDGRWGFQDREALRPDS